jgi:hypothetical protein
MKIPISEQIEAVDGARGYFFGHGYEPRLSLKDELALNAALSTLKWVERHQAELRVLGEFPIEKIEVLTPSEHGSSATSQVGSVEASPLSEGGK